MGDLEDRKLFVGGLSPETTEADLQSHYGQYGTIEHCEIKMDSQNNYKSKGFGFITYVEDESVNKALNAGGHHIHGRSIDTKRATKKKSNEPEKPKKCFLGGVSNETEEHHIREHFDQFGDIEEVIFPVDRDTKKRRGFAFVLYKDSAHVEKAVEHCRSNPVYLMDSDKAVDVKPATPRDQDGGRRGGRGGRGGFGRPHGGGGFGRSGYGGGGYDGYGGGNYNSYNQGGGGYGGYGGGNNGYSNYGQGGGGGYGGGYGGQGGGGGGYDSYNSGYGGGGGYGGQSSYGGGGDYGSGGGGSYGKTRGQRRGRGGYQPY